ncbi:MAG: wax ester/triacylglycerol synthase family O-acyltransferase [Xanthomonadales bacterium]|nr:wax ester/triacylglycerol synthase family O-acyltransferase [Xanthomonadales bacterium]
MHRLSTIDAGFLLTESHHSPKHVGSLQILQLPKGKGPAWLRGMLDDLKRVPPGFPFNQRLKDSSLLSPALVTDERLDIDYHVRHSVLPRPGSERQLVEMVARLHANLLDRERPLWEFHLIEGLSNRRFAFYTKVHHAIADGITFTRWFVESGSTAPDRRDSRPVWGRDEPPAPREDSGTLVELLADGVKMLGGGVRTAVDLSALSLRLLQKRLFERNRNAVLPLGAGRTRLNVSTGAARALDICRYPLAEFKAVARAHGASVNDLVMTLCDLAVHRYLLERDAAPDHPLIAYMPVNLRGDEGDDGNLISLLQVKLASDHGDPRMALQQIREASKSTREIYGTVSRPAIQLYSLTVALLPLAEELLGLEDVLPPAINLVISNVPGPPKTMYFRGAEVLDAYPISTLPPAVALNVTVCSYAGTLFFGLVGGRSALPDLHRLTEHLEAAYQELAELAG